MASVLWAKHGCARMAIVLCLSLFTGCVKEELRQPLDQDTDAPEAVSNVKVDPLNGGAAISYSLPDNLDLLYVEADYEIRPGVKGQAVSSFYGNSLVVNGFGDTAYHNIELYAVDRSGNRSEPVNVRVKPLISPVLQSYASLHYERDFGGIHVAFENPSKADIVVSVLVKDSIDEWEDYDKYYTGLASGEFSVRGLPAEPTTFGVYIRDRWDNHSDTLIQTLTPLYEIELDRSKFKEEYFPSDAKNLWHMSDLWDDNVTSNFSGFHSEENAGFPIWFSFSLGVKAKLSRVKTWQLATGNRAFSSGNIKQFEVWGSNLPSTDGSFDGWTLMQKCTVVKPSGWLGNVLSNEDVEAAANGQEFTISPDAPAVKYIRIKIISTFASPPGSTTGSAWLRRIAFWGQVIQ